MAQEKLISPPLRKPVQEYLTPDFSVGYFTELIDRTDPAYKTPVRGMPYASIRDAKQWVISAFPNLVFLKESRWRESDQFVTWTFGTDPAAEDTYNAEVTYSGESAACPIYARLYTVRRDVYDAAPTATPGAPLKTIISLHVTAHGDGYTNATVTASNGAKIAPVISAGQIVSLVLTAQGSDVTIAPTITITGDGSGATATAVIQSQSAVLVSQKKVEFPQDHPLRNEYVQVVRIYETIPGPPLTGTVITGEGQSGTLTRQTVAPGTTVTPSALMVSGKVEPESAGKSVLETVVVTEVFPETNLSVERPDVTPEKFRALIPTTTSSEVLVGTVALPSLSVGDLSKSEGQLTVFKKKTATTARAAVSLPVTITQKKTTPEGQVATVSETLCAEGDPSATASATVSFETEKLGDGRMVETVQTLPDVFPQASFSAERHDPFARSFVALGTMLPITSVEATSEGTAAAPTLGTEDISKSEQQVTKFKKRTSTKSRATGTLPISTTGLDTTSAYGGGVVGVIETLKDSGGFTVTPDYKTVSANVDPIGDGRFVEKVTQLPEEDEWPTLTEYEYIPEIDAFIKIEKTFVKKSEENTPSRTGGTSEADLVVTEFKDHDKWRSIKIVSTFPNSIIGSSRTFIKSIQYSVPDEIVSAPVLIKAYAVTPPPAYIGTIAEGAYVTDYAFDYKVLRGYSGPFQATVTRTISLTSATDVAMCWQERAELKNLPVALSWNQTSSGAAVRGKILELKFPPCIHGVWSIDCGDIFTITGETVQCWDNASHSTVHADYPITYTLPTLPPTTPIPTQYWAITPNITKTPLTATFAATNPATVTRGTPIIAAVHSEIWRGGLYINDVYKITIPAET